MTRYSDTKEDCENALPSDNATLNEAPHKGKLSKRHA